MEIRIQDVHFEATDALKDFVEKKVSKLDRYFDGILSAEVSMTLIKPETAANKEVRVRLIVPGQDLFATKVADTFEDALIGDIEALQAQLARFKEKLGR